MVNLQKTEIIEDLSWNKKVRSATVNGYDIKFIHINGQKETIVTSISEKQPISLGLKPSQLIQSVDNTSVNRQKQIVVTNVSEKQPISLYLEPSSPIQSIDNTSVQRTINFNKEVFKRFKYIK